MKTCRTCGEAKPLTEYHRHARSADRLDGRCKACKRVRFEDAWRHTAGAREKAQGWPSSRRYHAENPQIRWESRYRIRCRQYGIKPSIESFTRAELMARYGDACVHCGGPFEELDHYPVPVALGGAHSLDNCVPACAPCNRAGARTARDARALTLT